MPTLYWVGGSGNYSSPSSWSTASGGISNATTGTATVTSISSVILGTAALTSSTIPTLGNLNDGYWSLATPFPVVYLGRSYNNIYVNTNGMISFDAGTNSFNPFASGIPNISITLKNNAALRIYSGTEGTAPNRTYRVRYEGTDTAGIYTSGTPFIVWESTFYEATSTQIDVQVGANANGLSAVQGGGTVSGNFSRGTAVSINAPQVSPGRQAQISTTYNSDGSLFVTISNGGIGYTSAFLTVTTASAVNNIIADATTASYTLTNVSSTSGIYIGMLARSDWYMPANSFITDIGVGTIVLSNPQTDSTASNIYSFIDAGLSQTIPLSTSPISSGVYGVYDSANLLSSFPGTLAQNVQNQGFRVVTSGTAYYGVIPTAADDVVFDTKSNATAYIVTINVLSRAKSLTATGPASGAVTVTGSLGLYVSGNFTLAPVVNVSDVTWAAVVYFNGTSLVNIGSIVSGSFQAGIYVQGSVTLASDLTLTSSLSIDSGTFTTNNYNVTATSLISNTVNARTINLGASTITIVNASISVNIVSTNLTFNAGTSLIRLTDNAFLSASGITFYNVLFSYFNSRIYSSDATFNNLTYTGVGTRLDATAILIQGNIRVKGTLTFPAYNYFSPLKLSSTPAGTRRIITATNISSLSNINFQDINANNNPALPWSGTRLGNLGNNLNINFTPARTVYLSTTTITNNWTDIVWAITDGGNPSTDYNPLPQDSVRITNTRPPAGSTLIFDPIISITPHIQTFDSTARTNSLTFTRSWELVLGGDLLVGSGVALSGGTPYITFSGTATQSINSPVQPLGNIRISTPAVVQLTSITTSAGTVNLTSGTFSLNNYNLYSYAFDSSGALTRGLNFTSASINLTGGGAGVNSIVTIVAGGLTVAGTNPTINVIGNSPGTRTFSFGTLSELNSFNVNVTAGTGPIQLGGNIKNLDFTGSSLSAIDISGGGNLKIYGNLTLTNTTGYVTDTTNGLTFAASSGVKTIKTFGKVIGSNVSIIAPTATYQLQDDLVIGNKSAGYYDRTLTLDSGTLDVNEKNITVGGFEGGTTGVRALNNVGSATITITSSTSLGLATWNFINAGTGFSTNGLTSSTIVFTNQAKSVVFHGGRLSYGTVNILSSATVSIGTSTISSINFAGAATLSMIGNNRFGLFVMTQPGSSIKFTSSTNTFTNLTLRGAPGNPIKLYSTGTSVSSTSSIYRLNKDGAGTIKAYFIDYNRSAVTPANAWYAYGSIDSGFNTGWTTSTLLATSLTSTGTYKANADHGAQFVEQAGSRNRVGWNVTTGTNLFSVYSSQFDEVTKPGPASRQTSTGGLQIAGEFNEVTTPALLAYSVPATYPNSVEFTVPGTYTWTPPVGVTSVCVVCVGGGGSGGPGGAAIVAISGGNSQFTGPLPATTILVQAGGGGRPGAGSGITGDDGGYGGGGGGNGSNPGGGGAGGYLGGFNGNGGAGINGGSGGVYTAGSGKSGGGGGGAATAGGGGVGLYGIRGNGLLVQNGVGGTSGLVGVVGTYGGGGGSGGAGGEAIAGSPGSGGSFGGGGGSTSSSDYGGGGGALAWKNNISVTVGQSYQIVVGRGGVGSSTGGSGGGGAVRIIWGPGRSFPYNAG